MKPAYLKLLESGELGKRAAEAWRHMEDCDLCARYCRMNRMETIKGAVCRTGERAVQDPALARALDLLKALAVVDGWKRDE